MSFNGGATGMASPGCGTRITGGLTVYSWASLLQVTLITAARPRLGINSALAKRTRAFAPPAAVHSGEKQGLSQYPWSSLGEIRAVEQTSAQAQNKMQPSPASCEIMQIAYCLILFKIVPFFFFNHCSTKFIRRTLPWARPLDFWGVEICRMRFLGKQSSASMNFV